MSSSHHSRVDEVADCAGAPQSNVTSTTSNNSMVNGNSMSDGSPANPTASHVSPLELEKLLALRLENHGYGKKGLEEILPQILKYSINTWHPGFMDKLYSSTNAVGVVSDLILSVLNTNVHVYKVSPVLSIVEKEVAGRLAEMFGFTGPFSGGISQPGGSASNVTSLVIVRNTLFPRTKTRGTYGLKLAIFTSIESHFSIAKAAMICGLGTSNVEKIPANRKGEMIVSKLEDAIAKSKEEGYVPFYVNATAGTTVLGAFDPLEKIADLCAKHGMWMHVDGSWGGSFIFSPTHREKLRGVHCADSIAISPHMMLGVPLTCSFLLGSDLRKFQAANRSSEAAYLFHDEESTNASNGCNMDLADLTLQCGRRGDNLKFFLSWIYYGSDTYAQCIDHALGVATSLGNWIQDSTDFELVSNYPPSCLQVCFYFKGAGELSQDPVLNTNMTTSIARLLVGEGFMVDYAPGKKGSFFRVVIHTQTTLGTAQELMCAIRRCQRLVVDSV